MADIATLISRMSGDGSFEAIARDPRAQFGAGNRRYLGAEILPEVQVPDNAYREDRVKYRTVVANDGTRYSPAQKKAGDIVGSFLVELGNSDIAREFTGRQYDALLSLLNRNASMEATAQLTRWVNTTVALALAELNEKQRWEAIVNASVPRQGDNGYTETVPYSNPAGHRVVAGGTWSSNAYDPYPDIMAGMEQLASKGFSVGRMFASTRVASILSRNANMAQRTGRIVASAGSLSVQSTGRAALNDLFNADGLPTLELYDLQYRTQTATTRFLPDNVLVMVASQERDAAIDFGDLETLAPEGANFGSVLGYEAIGRAVGEPNPGRVVRAWFKDDKPPRIAAEGWQTSLPVMLEPEAIFVISGIA
jgi:hypothetical protein